jgi:hypothetical protein
MPCHYKVTAAVLIVATERDSQVFPTHPAHYLNLPSNQRSSNENQSTAKIAKQDTQPTPSRRLVVPCPLQGNCGRTHSSNWSRLVTYSQHNRTCTSNETHPGTLRMRTRA